MLTRLVNNVIYLCIQLFRPCEEVPVTIPVDGYNPGKDSTDTSLSARQFVSVCLSSPRQLLETTHCHFIIHFLTVFGMLFVTLHRCDAPIAAFDSHDSQ